MSRKEQIEELLKDDPNDPFLRYGLAMEHVSAGNDTEAARCFQGMFKDLPGYVPAYMQGGQVLSRLGRVDEARAAFERGIAAARQQGNMHAAEEMQGMIDLL
jgi:predicted RNA polymerase sigma factor